MLVNEIQRLTFPLSMLMTHLQGTQWKRDELNLLEAAVQSAHQRAQNLSSYSLGHRPVF